MKGISGLGLGDRPFLVSVDLLVDCQACFVPADRLESSQLGKYSPLSPYAEKRISNKINRRKSKRG
jgi:hypothetical protein